MEKVLSLLDILLGRKMRHQMGLSRNKFKTNRSKYFSSQIAQYILVKKLQMV